MLDNHSTLKLALVISSIWALMPIIQKFGLKKIPWKIIFFTNTIIQFIILVLIGIFFKKQFTAEWKKTDILTLLKYSVILTLLGIVSYALYYYVLKNRQTFDVILITSTYFIGTIVLNAMIFNESLTNKQIIATILVLIAVFLTT